MAGYHDDCFGNTPMSCNCPFIASLKPLFSFLSFFMVLLLLGAFQSAAYAQQQQQQPDTNVTEEGETEPEDAIPDQIPPPEKGEEDLSPLEENLTAPPREENESSSSGIVEENWLTYEDPLHGVTVNYPSNWTAEEDFLGKEGVTFMPPPPPPLDNGSAYFSIRTEVDSTGVLTAKDKLTLEMDEFGALDIDLTVFEAGPTVVAAGLDAERAVYTYRSGEDPMVGTLIVAKKDNTFYLIEATAPVGAEWDKLLPTFSQMLESVAIK
jgi:hypothetical protein